MTLRDRETMTDIVVTGNYSKVNTHVRHKVLRPGYKLYIGHECNDGRPIKESYRYKLALKMGIPIIKERPKIASESLILQTPTQMFVTKYTPTTIGDIIGHKEQISLIGNWLREWPEKKGLLVTGPPGIGKTTTVHLIAKELGYKVTEYNASDTRSVLMLKGILALGMKRLQKEVIVMDEVDGLSERGGVGEIAALIRNTPTPIICIANERPPKLKPIISVCLDIKFSRPMKSTIATALLPVVKAEEIQISKVELEKMCEQSGNDIRSILNTLDFYQRTKNDTKNDTKNSDNQGFNQGQKDQIHRLDLFSATQRLMSQKKMKITDAEDLVYVDYHMIPMMVQEAYATAAKDIDELEQAANLISQGDLMGTLLWKTQDWSLLPLQVATTVAVAKTVSGPAPFQIFPQYLGKNSKRLKHQRWMDVIAKKMRCNMTIMRMDYAGPLRASLVAPLQQDKPDIKQLIQRLDSLHLTRDDLIETLCEVSLTPVEIQTKVKTAFTREWNKGHREGKKMAVKEEEEEDENEDEDEDALEDI